MPDSHKTNQQHHKIFRVIYMWPSMIAKMMMMIIIICCKSCIFLEQLLPWEAHGGLLGTAPTILCPTPWRNLLAGKGCNNAEAWGTYCLCRVASSFTTAWGSADKRTGKATHTEGRANLGVDSPYLLHTALGFGLMCFQSLVTFQSFPLFCCLIKCSFPTQV